MSMFARLTHQGFFCYGDKSTPLFLDILKLHFMLKSNIVINSELGRYDSLPRWWRHKVGSKLGNLM